MWFCQSCFYFIFLALQSAVQQEAANFMVQLILSLLHSKASAPDIMCFIYLHRRLLLHTHSDTYIACDALYILHCLHEPTCTHAITLILHSVLLLKGFCTHHPSISHLDSTAGLIYGSHAVWDMVSSQQFPSTPPPSLSKYRGKASRGLWNFKL